MKLQPTVFLSCSLCPNNCALRWHTHDFPQHYNIYSVSLHYLVLCCLNRFISCRIRARVPSLKPYSSHLASVSLYKLSISQSSSRSLILIRSSCSSWLGFVNPCLSFNQLQNCANISLGSVSLRIGLDVRFWGCREGVDCCCYCYSS